MTKSLLKYALLGVTLTFAASTAANADVSPPIRQTAPEIDPSLAVAAISFIAGTLIVVRARRRK